MNSKHVKSLSDNSVASLLDALDDLIQIKTMIRKIVPTYQLTPSQEEEFKEYLNQLYEKLAPIFAEYLNMSSTLQGEKDFKADLLERYDKDTVIMVSANSSKKILKKIGIDPRQIIVTGGPLFFEDYKTINPNIPNKALKGIQKKCDRILNELNNKDWENNDLLFVYESDNKSDRLIIDKLDKLKKIIQSDVKLFEISNWEDLKE
ncbi:MAG: DUF2100 domain-containing protein [Promethearchaeia archaeon]